MKKLTFFLLALSGLVAALPAPDSLTCDDPSFPNLTKYFEEANIDIPIPFCSSLLAGGAPASAPSFKIQLVTAPEPTTTASPNDNELGTSTTINTTLPLPPQPTRPLPFPRRHLHALNHRAPSATDPPSAALFKICSCLLAQASTTPSPPPVYITILPRPLPTNEPATPGQVVYITVFPAPFPPIPLNAATTSTSTVVFQLPVLNAVFPSDASSPPATTTTTITPISAATTAPTRAPPLRFITRTTTSSILGTLTSTETTTTITTVVPQPQRELQLHMKIAHPGPRPGFARVALAAHGEDEEDEKEELTTTLTTTVEVTATAGTVTVTPLSVPEVTGAVVGAGGRVGAVRVAVVEGSGRGSGPGSGAGAVRGEAMGSGMGLHCPGEDARGYCCSGVNNTTGLPGGGGSGGGAGNGVECKSPVFPQSHASLPLAE